MSDLNKGNMSVGIGSICFAISAESDLSLAKEAVYPIPTDIFPLFKSLINARKETHDFFLRCTDSDLDPNRK
jgi:hypothetical protein